MLSVFAYILDKQTIFAKKMYTYMSMTTFGRLFYSRLLIKNKIFTFWVGSHASKYAKFFSAPAVCSTKINTWFWFIFSYAHMVIYCIFSIWGFAVGACHIRNVTVPRGRSNRSLSSLGKGFPHGETWRVPGQCIWSHDAV